LTVCLIVWLIQSLRQYDKGFGHFSY